MENYLTTIVQKFADWAKLKVEIHLHNNPHQVYFKERQIWWASVGQNIGVESNGKNMNFERPVIILKKFNGQAFLAVVLSTKQKSGDYYFQLTTTLEKSSFVNLSQIKLMSSKRLIRRVGEVSITDLEAVKEKIKNYL